MESLEAALLPPLLFGLQGKIRNLSRLFSPGVITFTPQDARHDSIGCDQISEPTAVPRVIETD